MTAQDSPNPVTKIAGPQAEAGHTRLKGKSLWQQALARFFRSRLAVFGLILYLLLVLSAALAPVLATHDPNAIDYNYVMSPPNAAHLFGTDNLGRDVFSRVLWGGRDSLRVGMIAVLISITGGSILGIFSGYVGGAVDHGIQRLVEVLMAFPTILLLLSIVAALGPDLTTILIAIGIAGIPGYSRLMRGSVLQVKNMDYILSARAIGAKHTTIMFRHILPNVLAPILVYGTLGLGGGILMTAGLSYLGLGAQPPSPEWGAMLNYGRSFLRSAPWMSIYPGMAVFIGVLSINLIGDGLRDALDPRLN